MIEKEVISPDLPNDFVFENKPSLRTKVKKTKITLSGNLTISNIDYFKSQFLELLSSYDLIDIELNDVHNLDLSFCQLFALFRQGILVDKTVTIKSKLDRELQTVLKNTGYGTLFLNK